MSSIKINDVTVKTDVASPAEKDATFSDKKLAVISLDLKDLNEELQQIVSEWNKAREVNVYDPFVDREYRAKVFQKSQSFQSGTNVKSFVIELTEIEEPLQIEKIELNGHAFEVLKYKESIFDGTIARQGVLKLSEQSFALFREMQDDKSINVVRVGIDEHAFPMRFGSLMYWSKHTDDNDGVFYKQTFRLFDLDLECSSRPGFANFVEHSNLAHLAVDYALKFETLLELLKEDENLSESTRKKLQSFDSEQSIIDKLQDEMYHNFVAVSDAEQLFD
ncbi:hypothetical protein [Vibrio parahaemolyticus]|uniref:hypothetical protein n=1 Tax=Vibrio parahaemolyticus TaxID=670 RepID=UPI0023621100|nr:hypothetical protein [Vibrio parahaemolyticus]EGR0300595.1 hypothetical protein [Vibrio parahaemolyticus]EKD9038840.1 hypothetical protein [Vibrio parahaemolyticus]EME0149095.1 hypothetical protein [Vibrio parahaemolyticus]